MKRPLRTGWTTGACAAAAAKAAFARLVTGAFPDPVRIELPGGERPRFALVEKRINGDAATAGVVKDAGDDPDITHGVLILATVRRRKKGTGVVFRAGEGVGTITLPGLQLPVGEPAINPAPRLMIRDNLAAANGGAPPDVEVTIAIPGGEKLARRTMNARLGIVGGLSVLGTTGIVRPYSCAAWIAAIHESIDVARALGLQHVAAATGRMSERAAQRHYGLPEQALIDMGDFAGGVLKYIRRHPVKRLTIAGGFAKLAKLAQGALDLHSARSSVDMAALGHMAAELGANGDTAARIASANTAQQALEVARDAGIALADAVAEQAAARAREVLRDAPVAVDVLVVARDGRIAGHAG